MQSALAYADQPTNHVHAARIEQSFPARTSFHDIPKYQIHGDSAKALGKLAIRQVANDNDMGAARA